MYETTRLGPSIRLSLSILSIRTDRQAQTLDSGVGGPSVMPCHAMLSLKHIHTCVRNHMLYILFEMMKKEVGGGSNLEAYRLRVALLIIDH